LNKILKFSEFEMLVLLLSLLPVNERTSERTSEGGNERTDEELNKPETVNGPGPQNNWGSLVAGVEAKTITQSAI
jgi:hypothetical protein